MNVIYVFLLIFCSVLVGISAGFVSAISLLFGCLIIWGCTYQALSALIYGESIKKKIIVFKKNWFILQNR